MAGKSRNFIKTNAPKLTAAQKEEPAKKLVDVDTNELVEAAIHAGCKPELIARLKTKENMDDFRAAVGEAELLFTIRQKALSGDTWAIGFSLKHLYHWEGIE